MEKVDSIDKTQVDNNEKINEFQILKNNNIYNIKINAVNDDSTKEKIKILISFTLNEKFYIYEECFDPLCDLKTVLTFSEIYQIVIKAIEDNKCEIIHQNDENNEYIIMKIDINNEIKEIKLLQSNHNNITKLNELIKNYKTLKEKYIQLKKEKEKDNIKKIYYNSDIGSGSGSIYNDNDSDNSINGNRNNYINANVFNPTIYENSDENHIILDSYSKIWCMLDINNISYIENEEKINLNLAALGLSNRRIILINLNTMKIHQEIQTPDTVYSLAKFNNDSKYLIAALENGQMIIYILKEDKYEQYQLLEKPKELKKGEINKVITLSDGNIATAERGALSIWKPKIEEGEKKFELFKEIITHNDTCQLLEINPGVFACAIYRSKLINVYKNDGNEYPLLGSITNAESHGSNSNGMAKINDNIFCSGGEKSFLYIASVEPLQIIQKIIMDNEDKWNFIHFIYNSNDGFIFTSIGDGIIQYKIVTDNDGNFIKLEEFDIIEDGFNNSAIIITGDGKILYKQKKENFDNKTNLFLTNYKKLDN